jgi:hypothetical protein
MAGLALAILAAKGPPLVLLAGVLGALFLILFLQRPDLGLLIVLFARASSDAVLLQITSAFGASSGLRGLLLNPNTALILILIGAGILTILARRLPMLSLPGGVLLVLLVFTGVVGIARSDDLLYSFQEWVPMLAAPVTYALAAGLFKNSSGIFRVTKVLAASFLLPAAIGYSQLLMGTGVLVQGFVRIYGTFVHPNPFGLYLVVVMAVFVPLAFFRSRMGVISRLIVPAVGPLLLATYARFAWAGSVIVLACIGIMRHRILLLIIPLIGLVALIPDVQMRVEDPFGGSFADRVRIWTGIYQEWLAEATRDGTMASSIVSILGGLGPGAAALLAARFRRGITPAHNDYIRLLIDHGVVGLLCYVLLAMIMIRLGYQAYRSSRDRPTGAIALSFLALAIAYPIMSITSNIVAATVNQLYFWTLAGLCVSLRENTQEHAPLEVPKRPGWP